MTHDFLQPWLKVMQILYLRMKLQCFKKGLKIVWNENLILMDSCQKKTSGPSKIWLLQWYEVIWISSRGRHCAWFFLIGASLYDELTNVQWKPQIQWRFYSSADREQITIAQ